MAEAKPFDISKQEVWNAFKGVKANQGAAGVDRQSIADFEVGLTSNLYKLWNRMSSGSYFPAPVRRVMIPKPRLRHGNGRNEESENYCDKYGCHRTHGGRPVIPAMASRSYSSLSM